MRPLFSVILLGCSQILSGKDLVCEVFKNGDFVPHALTDRQIVAAYGAGEVTKSQYEVRRNYFDSRCKAWLSASIQMEASPEYRFVQELTISSIPVSKKASAYKGDLCSLSLGGVALGDRESEIYKAGFSKAKRDKSIFADKELVKIILNPMAGETDLYYVFYVKDNLVVGMSIGVTE